MPFESLVWVKVNELSMDNLLVDRSYELKSFDVVPYKPLFYPLPKRQILNSSKLKQPADDNFEFHENSRKFSKYLENTVGKGEIAHYEQFLLFPQFFLKARFPGASKGVIVWKWPSFVRNRKNVIQSIMILLHVYD